MIKTLLASAALLAASNANAAWQEASSKHFVVYSDDAPAKVQAFTTELENFDGALRILLSAPDPAIAAGSRVTVFVTRDETDIHRLMGRGGGYISGFYIARASGSVAFVPRDTEGKESGFTPLVILLHEYAHHFMFSTWGDAPTPPWLVEGFAEFAATAKAQPDGSVVVGAAPEFRADSLLSYNQMSAQRLLTTSGGLDPSDAQAFYSRSWLLTHYLLLDPGRRKQFKAYLTAVNNGAPPLEAAKALGSLPALDVALIGYATRAKIAGFVIPADKLPPRGAIGVRELGPGEAAAIPARILSARGVSDRTAPSVQAMARKAAAPFPADAAAQNELAEAEYDAKDYTASEAAATRAIAVDPKSVHALIYLGMARMAQARAAKATDAARWQAVRAPLLQANRLDPEFPEPLRLFYESFGAAQQAPSKNAEEGLLYARQLAPFDLGLRFTAAHIYLARNQLDGARAMLRPIAYNPHGGGTATLAAKVLAAIDSGGAAAGLAAFKAEAKDAGGKPASG